MFFGDVSNTTGYAVNASSSSTNAVNVANTNFVQVTTMTATLRGSRPLIGFATVSINNAAAAGRTYTIQIERGGIAVSNSYINFVGANDEETATVTWFETSSTAGLQTYTLSVKTSVVMGPQTVDSRLLTLLEL